MLSQKLTQYSKYDLSMQSKAFYLVCNGVHCVKKSCSSQDLLRFKSDTGWEGLIDIQDWFAHAFPESAEMSSTAWSLEQLKTLFVNSKKPIGGLPEPFTYNYFSHHELIIKDLIQHDLYSYSSKQGSVWFLSLPMVETTRNTSNIRKFNNIKLVIKFELGRSHIPIFLLKQVKKGDVLFINEMTNSVTQQNIFIAKFSQNEDALMYENNDENIQFDDFDRNHEVLGAPEMPREKIQVGLSFIIQKNQVSINELESFYQGQVIPCNPEIQKNIIIEANGIPIAQGEIVWIEDRIGIEIKKINSEI